jgi:hypothetical protein
MLHPDERFVQTLRPVCPPENHDIGRIDIEVKFAIFCNGMLRPFPTNDWSATSHNR